MTLVDELGWERHNQVFDYPQRFQFIGNSGINNEFESKIDGSYTPLDYFKLFVDSSILDLVCKQTNLYAKEYGVSNIDNPWYDVNEDEIMVYIALKMLMSILRKPEERMYWTDNIMLLTPYFKGVMSHRRFTKIQQNLHFNNKKLENNDESTTNT